MIRRILFGPRGRMPGWEALLRAVLFLIWMIAIGLPWLGIGLGCFILACWTWGQRAPRTRRLAKQ